MIVENIVALYGKAEINNGRIICPLPVREIM
mgnify:CR=1 FL=1